MYATDHPVAQIIALGYISLLTAAALVMLFRPRPEAEQG